MGTEKFIPRLPSVSPPIPSPPPPPPRQPIHPPVNINRHCAIFCNKCKSIMKLTRLLEFGFYKEVKCSSHVSQDCIQRATVIKPKIIFVAICRNCKAHASKQPNIVCADCIEYFARWSFLSTDSFHINENFYK